MRKLAVDQYTMEKLLSDGEYTRLFDSPSWSQEKLEEHGRFGELILINSKYDVYPVIEAKFIKSIDVDNGIFQGLQKKQWRLKVIKMVHKDDMQQLMDAHNFAKETSSINRRRAIEAARRRREGENE